MIRILKRNFGQALIWFVAMGLFSSSAYASNFRMRIDDGGTSGIVITDGGAGDQSTEAGVIVYTGSFSGFQFTITTGISMKGGDGMPNHGELDLNSVEVRCLTSTSCKKDDGSAKTVRITLADDGYAAPTGNLNVTAAIGGTLTNGGSLGSLQIQSWVNNENRTPDLGNGDPNVDQSVLGPLDAIAMPGSGSTAVYNPDPTLITALNVDSGGEFALGGSRSFSNSGTFSLFTQATITFNGPGMVSFDATTYVTPEPTSLLLLGSGLASLGLFGRKKKVSPAKTAI